MKQRISLLIAIFISLFCTLDAQTGYWQEIGALNANGPINSMVTDSKGNIYASGAFTDSSGYYYVAKWNGVQWSEVGTINSSLNSTNPINALAIDVKDNLYAAGSFKDSGISYYIAKWNGIQWSALGGKNSYDTLYSKYLYEAASASALAIDDSGYIYASGVTQNGLYGTNPAVIKWNNKNWTMFNSNLGSVYSGYGYNINAMAVDKNAHPYVGGDFMDKNGYVYVAAYNAGWNELYNMDAHGGPIYSINIDPTGTKMYVAGNLDYIYEAISGSSGTIWYPMIDVTASPYLGYGMYSIITDKKGAVYSAGGIPKTNTEVLGVYKWNEIDTTWDEMGAGYNALKIGRGINGSPFIYSLCTDTNGHVYAAGNFTDNNGYVYVAKFTPCNGYKVPSINTPNSNICKGYATSLTIGNDTLKNITHWLWYTHKNDTIAMDSGVTINVTPLTTTTYYLKGDGGCVTQGIVDSLTILVNNAAIALSATPDTICKGSSSTIKASGASVYTWSPSSTLNQSTGSTVLAKPNINTKYTVVGTDTNKCNVKDSVTIYILPVPYAHYAIYPDTTQLHHWYVLNQCTGTPPLSYVWNWGDTSAPSTGSNPSHTYTNGGYFNVCVTVTDSFGCTNTYCDSSTYISRVAGSSSISVTVVNSLPTGVQNVTSLPVNIKIYPNPTTGLFNIEVPLNVTLELQVYNTIGEKISSMLVTGNMANTIDMSARPAGMYILKMSNDIYTTTTKMEIVK